MKNSITPARLRLILILLLFIFGGIGVGAFAFGYKQLSSFARESQQLANEARISESSIAELRHTEEELKNNKDIMDKAAKLVSTSKEYVYQDRIVEDIDRLAKEAGLSVKNVTFTEAKATAVTPTVAPTADGTAPADQSAPTAAVAQPTSVNTRTATVTLSNPAKYDDFLNFIHLVEQSLFRMQISQISLSHEGAGSGSVTSQTLNIEVYVR